MTSNVTDGELARECYVGDKAEIGVKLLKRSIPIGLCCNLVRCIDFERDITKAPYSKDAA